MGEITAATFSNLGHLTPAYIFKLYIDSVDMYTYCKGRILLELHCTSGLSNLTSETIYNEIVDFTATVC